jgi:hypothetical protein
MSEETGIESSLTEDEIKEFHSRVIYMPVSNYSMSG